MDSVQLVALAILLCWSSLAPAAEATQWQTSLTLVAEAVDIVNDGVIYEGDLTAEGWLEEALMDWRFFDGGWAPDDKGLAHDAPDFARPLKRISRSRPSARSAVLAIAEAWRTEAQTAIDLLMAYMLVQGLRRPLEPASDAAIFRPTRADERRLLQLGLRTLRARVMGANDPVSVALRADLERGAGASLMRSFEALPEIEWSTALEDLMAHGDTPKVRAWAIHSGAFIRLREVRVSFMGLTNQSVD